jgi:hypothetical protein
MADLSAAARKKIPASKFGIPGKAGTAAAKAKSGNYPMPDRSHAANAKARASQAVKAGRMSSGTQAKINAKANKVLGKKKATK